MSRWPGQPIRRYPASEIGGILWDIQRDDWAALLDQLGAQAAGLQREYFLFAAPVIGTIEVQVADNGNVLEFFESAVVDPPDGDWTYSESRNSITFLEYMPGAGSKVMIDYELASAIVTEGG